MEQIISSLKQLAIPKPMADELSWLKPTYNCTSNDRELAAMSDWSADIKPMTQDGAVLSCADIGALGGRLFYSKPLVHPRALTDEFIIIIDVLTLPEFCSITMGFFEKGKAEWKDLFEMRGKGRFFIFKDHAKSECYIIDVNGRTTKSLPFDTNLECLLHPYLYFGRKGATWWDWDNKLAEDEGKDRMIKVSIKIGNAKP